MKNLLPILIILIVGCQQQLDSKLGHNFVEPKKIPLTGNYLGQPLPDSTPVVFAPDIVCNGLNNRDISISRNGNEIYWTTTTADYRLASIFCAKKTNGFWSDPEILSFANNPQHINIEPCLNDDNSMLFYATNRPLSDTSSRSDMNIWKTSRTDTGWSSPEPLPYPVNTNAGEYYPSLTKEGTLYFTREEEHGINYIYKSDLTNKGFQTVTKLPDQVNCGVNRFNAFIDPHERFIIIPAMGVEKNVSGVNYYISFRQEDNTWSDPENMGPTINNELGRGWSASLSPDGNYLFFMSSKGLAKDSIPNKLTTEFFNGIQIQPQNGNPDIYWVKADFLYKLKQ